MDKLTDVLIDIIRTPKEIPVTDSQWMEFIGAGPKAQKATMEQYQKTKELAEKLRKQLEM